MSNLLEGFLSTPEVMEVFSERNFLDAMLRFEAALARAQASAGLIPQAAAQSIIGTCKVELFDVAKIARDSVRAGSIATPFMSSLRETVGLFNREAAGFVHFGATSQDVMDTALALVTRQALALVEADVKKAVAALLQLAERHADDPMLARTQMQPAGVTSFGLKCAAWAAPLVRSLRRLDRAGGNALCVQWGGAVRLQPDMQGREAGILLQMAADLELRAPLFCWPTQRDEWVALGCEMGLLVGSLGKMARDVSLMSQYEVGELAEAEGKAVLSGDPPHSDAALAQPRNPGGCMVALAAAGRAPQRVAALLASMPQEHERALGNWQAELAEWPGLLMSAHGAARAMAQVAAGLQVDAPRMRANLEAVRAAVPAAVAGERFSPRLAAQAAQLARVQATALRGA